MPAFVRVLALAGVLNVVMAIFNVGFNYVNQHADVTPPHVASYFANGFCGLSPSHPCPPQR